MGQQIDKVQTMQNIDWVQSNVFSELFCNFYAKNTNTKYFIPWKHNALFCISYTFIVFQRKNRHKKTIMDNKENSFIVIHRRPENHII